MKKMFFIAIILVILMANVFAEPVVTYCSQSGQRIQINAGNSTWETKAVKEFEQSLQKLNFNLVQTTKYAEKTIIFGPNPGGSLKGKYVTIQSGTSMCPIKLKDFNPDFVAMALN